VGVDMTEVDVVALQLITAAYLATSTAAVGPAATSAADGGGAAGSYVAGIVDVTGGRVAFTFSEYKTKRCWLDYSNDNVRQVATGGILQYFPSCSRRVISGMRALELPASETKAGL
jgi:hypothetical protein